MKGSLIPVLLHAFWDFYSNQGFFEGDLEETLEGCFWDMSCKKGKLLLFFEVAMQHLGIM